jgi:iron-sulfur cluster assembly accessory protein
MITITEAAALKLKGLLVEHNSSGITITADPGGCSGIDYTLSYQTEENQGEELDKTVAGEVTFFYSKGIEPLVNGMHVDLMENSFGHGFVISNKNFSPCQGCTCGRSNDCQT